MSSRDDQWWDLQAAEYVLGTLSDDDHIVFTKLLASDPDAQARVLEWQTRLDPLNRNTQAIEPAPHVFDNILANIGQEPTSRDNAKLDHVSHSRFAGNEQVKPDQADSPLELDKWRANVRFWKTATVASLATAAALIGFLVFNPQQWSSSRPTAPTTVAQVSTVTVLENEIGVPVWAINFDPTNDNLIISVVGQTQLEDDQSHQLWMVLADGSGVQSVGLMPNNPGDSITLSLPIELSAAKQLAVSLEPFGGVVGPEHGPVVAINTVILPTDSI